MQGLTPNLSYLRPAALPLRTTSHNNLNLNTFSSCHKAPITTIESFALQHVRSRHRFDAAAYFLFIAPLLPKIKSQKQSFAVLMHSVPFSFCHMRQTSLVLHLCVTEKIGVALSSRLLRAAPLGRPPVAFTNSKKAM
jgi:Mg2+ and Co2+ transporter CorA